MDLRLILAPYELGSERVGEGRGPDRWMAAGVDEVLRRDGHLVEVEALELPPPGPCDTETGRTFELARGVSRSVASARRAHRFPLVLGGSCMTSVGVVAGLGSPSPAERIGVAWFDAHGDFNTPETTTSGYLDGMPLAVITGRCWKSLSREVSGFRPVSDAAVALIGVRDLDPLESDLLRNSEVTVVPAEQVHPLRDHGPSLDALLGEGLRRVRETSDILHLHIDLDVLDPAEVPANHYPAAGGLSTEQLMALLRRLPDHFDVGAVTIAAYDPACDPDGKAPPVVNRMVRTLAHRDANLPHRGRPA